MLRLRLIRRPIRIHNQVNHRMIALKIIQPNFRPEERQDLQPDKEPVYMRIRNLPRRFEPVNRQVVCFKLQVRQTPAELVQLHASARRFLQFHDQSAPHPILKCRSVRNPRRDADQNDQRRNRPQHAKHKKIPRPVRVARRRLLFPKRFFVRPWLWHRIHWFNTGLAPRSALYARSTTCTFP